MPATTPVYGITYPLDSDKVAGGAAAIRSTAETVEGALVAVVPDLQAEADAAIARVNAAAGNPLLLPLLFGGL